MNKKQIQELRNLITEIEGQMILFDSDNWPMYQRTCVEWGDKVAPFLVSDEKKKFNRELDLIRAVIHQPILPSDFSGAPKEGSFKKMKSVTKQRLQELEDNLTLGNNVGNPTDRIEQKEWYQRPIGYIGITVVAGVLILLVAYLIKKHFGIPL